MTQSSSLILTTKLVIPAIQGDIVKRPRLLDKLRLAHPLPVNIISAPAGFGKTTLMANWISNINKPVAWYSLDEADNDPVRFITHFIAAMQTIIPAFGDAELELLTHSQSIPILSLMPGLINAINQHYQTIIFIFDDFQFISNSTVLNAVVSLIDHQPVNLILGITSRVDPSLPLPRLRVRRQLNEITDQDLRFTVEEARDYLQILMGLNLSNENIQTLEQKTEGWIAGLQLAGLSLQGNKQPDEFIASFSGDDRYVIDNRNRPRIFCWKLPFWNASAVHYAGLSPE